MALLTILHSPDPRLREKALPVETVDRTVRTLMDNLLETLYNVNGLGLASTQVGINKRVIVVNVAEQENEPSRPLVMANPELLWVSPSTQVTHEGCYSIPGFYEKVTRPLDIKVTYLDENNKTQDLTASGLLSACIQHEIDHLNGVLFIDNISALKRNIILHKLRKEKKLRT